MRYSLLASAGLILFAFAGSSASHAADCGCAPAVRAALAGQTPMVKAKPKARPRPAPHRMASARPAMRCTPCAAAAAGSQYQYASAGALDAYPSHRWMVAPQGYVPPPPDDMPMVPAYDGPADLPPYGPPMSYAPPAPSAYAEGYGAQQGITVEQQGWMGGVGYERSGGGGGGGGGGGLTLTLSQPDSLNGPSYNSFGQSYGGDYQSANQVNQFRQQAFTPPSNGGGSGSGSGSK